MVEHIEKNAEYHIEYFENHVLDSDERPLTFHPKYTKQVTNF
jgi:hypothetical protein